MKVPAFLDHLRRDDRSRPVPWINVWAPDVSELLRLAPDPNVSGELAVFQDEPEGGAPDFTRQCLQRQREAVTRGLCQVCGRPVSWPCVLVVSSMSVSIVTADGRREVVVTEPWLDVDCAAFALQRCPGLIRRKTAKDLMLVTVDRPEQTRLVVSRGWIDGPLEAESKRLQPVMWAKLAIGAPG